MSSKPVIVDGRNHMLGRLASVVAKQLLMGQHVVIVRCEEVNISGSLFRNKIKYHYFLAKRGSTNPRRGPFHYRAPSRIVWRCIRGMVPRKTKMGNAALGRLKVFEGVPHPFDKMKRMVVPDALRHIRLKPERRFCRLGDLSSQVGWKHDDLIKRLEATRKKAGAAYYKVKKVKVGIRAKAQQAIKNEPVVKELAALGY